MIQDDSELSDVNVWNSFVLTDSHWWWCSKGWMNRLVDMRFPCQWDNPDGTRDHNCSSIATYKWEFYVCGTISYAKIMCQPLRFHCLPRIRLLQTCECPSPLLAHWTWILEVLPAGWTCHLTDHQSQQSQVLVASLQTPQQLPEGDCRPRTVSYYQHCHTDPHASSAVPHSSCQITKPNKILQYAKSDSVQSYQFQSNFSIRRRRQRVRLMTRIKFRHKSNKQRVGQGQWVLQCQGLDQEGEQNLINGDFLANALLLSEPRLKELHQYVLPVQEELETRIAANSNLDIQIQILGLGTTFRVL